MKTLNNFNQIFKKSIKENLMKAINNKYMWNVFSAILVMGVFFLSNTNTIAASDKNSTVNESEDISQTDKEKNLIESDDPSGPRDRDPSEVVLPSENSDKKSGSEEAQESGTKNP